MKTASVRTDAPKTAAPDPLPQEGGSYTRQPDGTLARNAPQPAEPIADNPPQE